MKLPALDDLFSTQEERDEVRRETVRNIPISEINDFPNHPFKVKMDENMSDLVDSIREYGVQVPALVRPKEDGSYETHSLSIEDLASEISNRYGLIINGVHEERFANADVETNAAFKVNMDAFKNKLRQIGFYTDMSDACILQKIRPRYKLDE